MKVTKEKFQEYMSQFKPLDVKIKDVWSNKGNIIRGLKINNTSIACIINWKSYYIYSKPAVAACGKRKNGIV